MTILHHPFLLKRSTGRDIHGAWHVPASNAHGTVLFLHGYKGYMDWGAWRHVGDRFASEGWRFLRINFTHNGTTPEQPTKFTDLEAFAANTYSKERDEAVEVLQALRSMGSTKESKWSASLPICVIGHSRGGGVACLAAAEADQVLQKNNQAGINQLVTWAAVADFESRFPKGAEMEAWNKSGQHEIINHRTRQRLHHNWSFYEDFTAQRERLSIETAVRNFGGQMLIAHGEEDDAVSIDHAIQLNKWAPQSELFLMPKTGHTFGSSEPWTKTGLPQPLEALTQETLRFLSEGRASQN